MTLHCFTVPVICLKAFDPHYQSIYHSQWLAKAVPAFTADILPVPEKAWLKTRKATRLSTSVWHEGVGVHSM